MRLTKRGLLARDCFFAFLLVGGVAGTFWLEGILFGGAL